MSIIQRERETGLLTTREAADRLGVPRERINSWLQSKKRPLPSVKIGNRRYVSEQDLTEYVKLLERIGLGIKPSTEGTGTGKMTGPPKEDPWILLSAAIVREAMKDYKRALKQKNWGQIRAEERWIRSGAFELLTLGGIEARYLITTMRDKYL